MKIKQLQFGLDGHGIYHGDFMWQYYHKDGRGYGGLLQGYLIVHGKEEYFIYYGNDEIFIDSCKTLDGAKQLAQEHFEHSIKLMLEEEL